MIKLNKSYGLGGIISMSQFFILIVEDEQNQRLILEEALRTVNPQWSVRSVSSACDALALLDYYIPDLIITDYSMPMMTGIDLIQRIRQRNINTHIILISASSESGICVDMEQLRIDLYLTKPVPLTSLRQAASTTLEGVC